MSILELAQVPSKHLEKRSQISEEDIILPDTFNVHFVRLLKVMLQRAPDQRPSPHQLLLDPLIIDHSEWQLYQDNVILKQRLEELEDLINQYYPLNTPPMKKAKFFDILTGCSKHPKSNNIAPNSPPTSPLNSSLESVSDSYSDTRTPSRVDADHLSMDYNQTKGFLTESVVHSPYIYGSRLRPSHTHRRYQILKQPTALQTPHGTYAHRYIGYSSISDPNEELMDTDMLYTPISPDHSVPETPPTIYRQVNSKYVNQTSSTAQSLDRTNNDVYFLSHMRKSLISPLSPSSDMLPR